MNGHVVTFTQRWKTLGFVVKFVHIFHDEVKECRLYYSIYKSAKVDNLFYLESIALVVMFPSVVVTKYNCTSIGIRFLILSSD